MTPYSSTEMPKINSTTTVGRSIEHINNFTEWSIDESFECYGATDEEMEIYAKISFW
jgi:hypothetical protein